MKILYQGVEVIISVIETLKPIPDISFDNTIGDFNNDYGQRHIIEQRDVTGLTKRTLIANDGSHVPLSNDSLIHKDKAIYFCSGKYICKWNITQAVLEWCIELDFVSCFTIQFLDNEDSILVSGESELSKIDLNGSVLWQYSGFDIFVTQDGKFGAKVIEDKIYITDWNDILHVLDFEGNLINCD